MDDTAKYTSPVGSCEPMDDHYNRYCFLAYKKPLSSVDPIDQRTLFSLSQYSPDHGNCQEISKQTVESVRSGGQTTTAIQSDTGRIHVIHGLSEFTVGMDIFKSVFCYHGAKCMLISHCRFLCRLLHSLSNQPLETTQHQKYLIVVVSDKIETDKIIS